MTEFEYNTETDGTLYIKEESMETDNNNYSILHSLRSTLSFQDDNDKDCLMFFKTPCSSSILHTFLGYILNLNIENIVDGTISSIARLYDWIITNIQQLIVQLNLGGGCRVSSIFTMLPI